MIKSGFFCNCFNATKRCFCVNMWQWIQHHTPESNQLSAEWTAADESRLKRAFRKHQKARFWPLNFGMCKLFCSSITLRKEKTINSEYYIALLVRLKEEIAKNGHKWTKKSALSPRQCTVSHVDRNNGVAQGIFVFWFGVLFNSTHNFTQSGWLSLFNPDLLSGQQKLGKLPNTVSLAEQRRPGQTSHWRFFNSSSSMGTWGNLSNLWIPCV